MTVKQWLNRGYRANMIIQMLEDEKEEAFETATNVTAPMGMEKIKSSGGNGSERKYIEYSNYSLLLDMKIEELKQIQSEIETVISKIDNNYMYEILHRRYTKYEKFADISDAMYLSLRQVYRIHKEAIYEVEKILKNVTKCH